MAAGQLRRPAQRTAWYLGPSQPRSVIPSLGDWAIGRRPTLIANFLDKAGVFGEILAESGMLISVYSAT